jgi:ATPase subunit of ABC transporter with duplicated ATPase domains
MLKISNLSKSYGIVTILKDINLVVSPGERLGLIGSNGSGKTTLLRLIARHEQADSGSIQLDPPGLRIGYLPQGQHRRPFDTLESYLSGPKNDLQVIEQDLTRLAAKLAETPQDGLLQQAYDHALYRLEQAVELERLAPLVLAGLGLGGLSKQLPVAHLSGGQKTRLRITWILRCWSGWKTGCAARLN